MAVGLSQIFIGLPLNIWIWLKAINFNDFQPPKVKASPFHVEYSFKKRQGNVKLTFCFINNFPLYVGCDVI